MLDQAAMEALKVQIKMEELYEFLDKIVDEAAGELKTMVHNTGVSESYFTARISENGRVIAKCKEVQGIIDGIRMANDKPVDELYKYIFRNDPVALNLEKLL